MNLTQLSEDFEKNGLAVVKGFASAEECEAMRDEMKKICEGLKADEIHCFETESGSSQISSNFHFFKRTMITL